MKITIYCADIGSVPNHRFGWARMSGHEAMIERHRGGEEIGDLVDELAADLARGGAVALGFECPLFVPVPHHPQNLGKARIGEGNRSWSAGAGAGALATGIVEVAWILSELRKRAPAASIWLHWSQFKAAGHGLFLWEAFVTASAKSQTHVGDAALAVAAFRDALNNLVAANAVSSDRPLSIVGAALLWSGWSDDTDLLHTPCVVIKVAASASQQ